MLCFFVQGAQNETLPYVYYTPSYGYAQTPYNPYNPYIPGAVTGVDSPFIGAQQYYAIPPYQDPVSSPAYVPVVIQPDMLPNNEPLFNTSDSIPNKHEGRGLKQNLASASATFSTDPPKLASNQRNPSIRASGRASSGYNKQVMVNGPVPSVSYSTAASSCVT